MGRFGGNSSILFSMYSAYCSFYLSYMAGVGMASFNEEGEILSIFDIELLFPQLHFVGHYNYFCIIRRSCFLYPKLFNRILMSFDI